MQHQKSMKRRGGAILGLVGALILSLTIGLAAAAPAQQDEGTPLIIGYYGDANSPGGRGLLTAINEMQNLDPIAGGDGNLYRLEPRISLDLAELSEAVAILTVASSPVPEEAISLEMPIILLSNDAELSIENIEAPFFRGVSSSDALYDSLADYIAAGGTEAQQIALIGDEERYGEAFEDFAAAIAGLAPNENYVFLPLSSSLPTLEEIDELIERSIEMIVYRGEQADAGAFLEVLAAQGWTGLFFYDAAYEAGLRGMLESAEGITIWGITGWSNAAPDRLSQLFRQSYISYTGRLPNDIAVSAYDLTWALRLMIGRVGADPATLAEALPSAAPITTTQGTINPTETGGVDLFRSAMIYEWQELGGMRVLARYDEGALLEDDPFLGNLPTATPEPSPTPSQAVVTVTARSLTVRSGPGLNYESIGSLAEGVTVGVVGVTADYSWFYIQASNGLGWVSAQFVQLFNPLGGVTGIEIIQAPPTPIASPPPPAAPTVAGQPDLVIDSVVLNPTRPIIGQAFTATVTIRNAGAAPAGAFSVGATWQPGNVASVAQVGGVAAGQSEITVLQAILPSAGAASVNVNVDVLNEVAESNEANNSFTVSYVADAAPTVATSATFAPLQINFAGNQEDMDWTGAAPINALNGARFGIIGGISYDNVHVGLLTAGAIVSPQLTVAEVIPGQIFGLRTGQGHCGVFRIDSIAGANITFTYRMYDIAVC